MNILFFSKIAAFETYEGERERRKEKSYTKSFAKWFLISKRKSDCCLNVSDVMSGTNESWNQWHCKLSILFEWIRSLELLMMMPAITLIGLISDVGLWLTPLSAEQVVEACLIKLVEYMIWCALKLIMCVCWCVVGGERRNQLNKVTVYSIGRGQSTLSCFFKTAKQKREEKRNILHIHQSRVC